MASGEPVTPVARYEAFFRGRRQNC